MDENEIQLNNDRPNPFDSNFETNNEISEVYNVSNTPERISDYPFVDSIDDNFFNVPYVGLNENSSLEELQDGIIKCKHIYLSLTNQQTEKKDRMLDRLIELRRLLQLKKESSLNEESGIGGSSYVSAAHLNLTQSMDKLSSSSLDNRNVDGKQTSHSLSRGMPGGHRFESVTGIHCLGKLCESCGFTIKTPTSKVYNCTFCNIICHPDVCVGKLTRKCPCIYLCNQNSSFATRSNCRPRTISDHDKFEEFSSKSMCELKQKVFYKHMELTNLNFLSASLTHQRWHCADCQTSLNPAPNMTVFAEQSLLSNIVKKASSTFEKSINSLTHRASEDKTLKEDILRHATPQLSSQLPSLSNHLFRLASFGPSNLENKSLEESLIQFASIAYHHNLGPIQTWGDARVLEVFSKSNHANTKSIINGTTASNQLENIDKAKLCYYTGQYYCSQCHWGDTIQVPACIFVLGDYKVKPVCRSAYLWLKCAWSTYVFRIPNAWYYNEPLARPVFQARLRLGRLNPYFDNCSEIRKIKTEIEKEFGHWIIEQPFTFTMDLVAQVLNQTLIPKLEKYLNSAIEHVDTCEQCSNNVPSACVVCKAGPIRTFELKIALCKRCNGPCHRKCLKKPLPDCIPATHAPLLSKTTNDTTDNVTNNNYNNYNKVEDEDIDSENENDECNPTSNKTAQLTENWIEIIYPAIGKICINCDLQ